jgi:hypothetical protein
MEALSEMGNIPAYSTLPPLLSAVAVHAGFMCGLLGLKSWPMNTKVASGAIFKNVYPYKKQFSSVKASTSPRIRQFQLDSSGLRDAIYRAYSFHVGIS